MLVLVALVALAGAGPAGAAPRWHEARTLDPQWGDHASVQVDAAGETVLAWQRPVTTGIELMVATRPRGGGFSLPTMVAKDVSTGFQSATAGRFTMLMWRGEDDLWAVLREAGGAFSAPQRVATGISSAFRFALNASGDAVFAYSDRAETIQLVRRSRAGVLGGPIALSGVRSSWPAVTLAADGGALVVWERLDRQFAVEWREVAADDTLGHVGRFGSDHAQLPSVVGAPDGSALVRWIGGDPSSPALRSGHAAWQLDPPLHPTAGDDVAVAIRDQGRLRLAWREGTAVKVALRDAGGSLGDERQVEALGAAPGTVTMSESAEGQSIVMATERDPAGGYSAVAAVESGTTWHGVSGIVTQGQQWPSASVGGGVAAVAEWSASGLRVRAFDETDAPPAVAPPAAAPPAAAPPAAAPRDARAPVVGLSRTRRRQRAGTHVVARVACDEICAVAVTGKARAGRSWRLAGGKLALTRPGEAGTLRLKVPAGARRALARRGGVANLSITAFDAAGNRSLARVAIRIGRRPR